MPYAFGLLVAGTLLVSAGPAFAQPALPSRDANVWMYDLAEAYFEELLPLNPGLASSIGDDRYNHLYSPVGLNREQVRELQERTLLQLQDIDPAALDAQHHVTYDILRLNLETALRGDRFPGHLQPVDQYSSFLSGFATWGSGTSLHPFRTVKDYDDFLARIQRFTEAVDFAIANMRQGVAMGVVKPRAVTERILPQLSAHVVDDPEASLFYQPIQNLPANFSTEDRERLTAAYRVAIETQVIPAYQRMHAFIEGEYLVHTRPTVGQWALPDGEEWYAHIVRVFTTTDLTPEEIHQIGLAEVARIHGEMEVVKAQVGFTGTLREFFVHLRTDPVYTYLSREEMLLDYQNAKARIDASTDRLFDLRPAADYEIRPVEEFRERTAAAGSYLAASPDGARPGIFYLNTYEPQTRARYDLESLLLHEGSPGHHFQISIQRELENLPRVRRFGGFTVFSEGWALYAESLGRELGLYTDPYQYYGALAGELWRAIRLVVDTGIHAKQWTRDQAIEYGIENSSEGDPYIVAEIERYIANPGQALAYKIGQMKITELRERSERELGSQFDIRAFHRQVLQDGAMPLNVLEAKIERWITASRI